MIWATWRQHRQEAFIGLIVLILLMGYLVIDGTQMYAAASHWSLFSCRFDGSEPQSCRLGMSEFQERFLNLGALTVYILYLLPAILGVFVGAPLVAREVEQRTHIVAWTQSVSRLRWFGVKTALVTGATLLAASVLAGLATWWHRPLDLVFINQGSWHSFSVVGLTPVAYAIFALALGITVGTVIRRAVPAMAITLVLFAAARAAIQFLRPMFAAPLKAELDYANPVYPANALIVNVGWVDANGNQVSFDRVNSIIDSRFPGAVTASGPSAQTPADAAAINQYLHSQGLHYLAVYQPGDRFWSFQVLEAGIFLVLALILVGLATWWLRHRVR